MKTPFLHGHRWLFRGYRTLEDFIYDRDCLYKLKEYPSRKDRSDRQNYKKTIKSKYIYILSKVFFDSYVHHSYWDRFEFSSEFENCVFIYEDHEESASIDYRWIEVMRKRRKGVYIKDSAPSFYNTSLYSNNAPVMVAGHFPVYDKNKGEPFDTYRFNRTHGNEFMVRNLDRDIDVLFIGSVTTQRKPYMDQIRQSCKKLGLNSIISRKMVSPREHIELMRRSKICYNLMAIGYRSSREWESLLNGCLLISDDRTVDNILTPGMELDKDFVRLDSANISKQIKFWINNTDERERISTNGFNSAWKVWSGCTDPYMPSRQEAAKYIVAAGWDR